MRNKSPIFIIGNPRSGTTLIRLILTAHPAILIPPECGFVIWLKNKYADWNRYKNNDDFMVSMFLDDLFACKKFDTWLLDRAYIRSQIVANQPTDYADLCSVVYGAYGLSAGREFTVWGDKNNFYIDYINEILALYSKARFLHIVRDGRDVACSYREVMAANSNSPYAPKLHTDISDVALEWSMNVMKIELVMKALPRAQAMTIKYEDLVVDAQETLQRVCKWLDLIFEPEMLSFYIKNKESNLEPELTMDWKKRTVQPISDQTIGRYKYELNRDEILEFESVASKALKSFSYDL